MFQTFHNLSLFPPRTFDAFTISLVIHKQFAHPSFAMMIQAIGDPLAWRIPNSSIGGTGHQFMESFVVRLGGSYNRGQCYTTFQWPHLVIINKGPLRQPRGFITKSRNTQLKTPRCPLMEYRFWAKTAPPLKVVPKWFHRQSLLWTMKWFQEWNRLGSTFFSVQMILGYILNFEILF